MAALKVYLNMALDRLSAKSKAWTGFTLIWLSVLFILSCTQANVSEASEEGDTSIMPDFQCGKWLSSELNDEWGMQSPGEYNNPYGIEYSDGDSEAEWECGWPTVNSVFRLLTLSMCLVASSMRLGDQFGLSFAFTTPAVLSMYLIGLVLMFASAAVDCVQIRIGSAVCQAHLAAVIKATGINSMECDNGAYIATAAGGFLTSIFMGLSFFITTKAAAANELANVYEEAAGIELKDDSKPINIP